VACVCPRSSRSRNPLVRYRQEHQIVFVARVLKSRCCFYPCIDFAAVGDGDAVQGVHQQEAHIDYRQYHCRCLGIHTRTRTLGGLEEVGPERKGTAQTAAVGDDDGGDVLRPAAGERMSSRDCYSNRSKIFKTNY
jgi:hypothetical protein